MIRNMAEFSRALPAGFDGVFHWDFLHGAFGGNPKVKPMDFDAVVERHKRFLVFETKTPGAPVDDGQRKCLQRLVLDPRFTVVFCAKQPRDIDGWQVLTHLGYEPYRGNAHALRTWCSDWDLDGYLDSL